MFKFIKGKRVYPIDLFMVYLVAVALVVVFAAMLIKKGEFSALLFVIAIAFCWAAILDTRLYKRQQAVLKAQAAEQAKGKKKGK